MVHVGLSVVVASSGYSLVVICMGFSLRWLLLGSTGSIVVAHELGCSWIFLDQGLNPCLLHWPVDSLPLSHQGSLVMNF